ncbi:outer membrane beta-barrel protein [Paraferrimonas sp. SM1919]|uniref:outer membrane beta-barrel protein n=1 Tax=Paraferrimonas sp. SM1919 TaxID=2662263 RepID=UPI0013D69388|nr:outer membrane beta-barrel protein [Paraferrimonas sp. SM1919]
MNKVIFAALVAMLPFHSQASIFHEGLYAGVELNEQRSHINGIYDSNHSTGLYGGLNLNESVALEAGYHSFDLNGSGLWGDTKVLSFAPVMSFPLNANVATYLKFGLASVTRNVRGKSAYDHQHGFGYMAQAGIKASLSRGIVMRVGYHYLETKYHHSYYHYPFNTERSGLAMGLQFQF